MKTTYKVTSLYNQKNLYEAYKSLRASKIGILLFSLSIFAIFLSILAIILYGNWDINNTLLLFFPLITGLCCLPYSRAKFHVMSIKSRYHNSEINYNLSFNDEGIEIYNTVSKGTINIFYSQCDHLYETKNLFVISYDKRYVILIEKSNLKKGEISKFKNYIESEIQKKSEPKILKTLSV